jgi:uncharacterized membrane protein
MALPPLEIKYRKSALYGFFALALAIVGVNVVVLALSGTARSAAGMLVTAFPVLILGIIIWRIGGMIRNPPLVLTFTSEGLHLHRRRPVFIPWPDVAQWKMRTYKGNDTLVVRTITGKKYSVGISWLTASSGFIQELMRSYIRMPGPGGFRN